ncbi:sugar isomerase [Nonomuraea phyllanthi]|uniref:Glutamine--fructose-6-phosphate aminotransferase [isomerizing] n=1 Tax=Nonomuraea phyllanthi TaxID=2219224 RepID=A0A5C4W4L5_9ACTN|nr:SIS domain-containing protein [Nonomuraea phyllanthi]KAB8191973.1 sugar isomerase [Nonomuraea phyllanthi]
MTGVRIPYLEGRARQPAALERIAARVAAQLPALGDVLAPTGRPVFVGIGASYAALTLPVGLLAEGGILARRELAGELGPGLALTDADLMLAVSQSGRSTETLDSLSLMPQGRRAAVVNVVPSLLSQAVDHCVDLGNEPDSYASTIGYTGTLVALAMIARTLLGAGAAEAAKEWDGIGAVLERHEAALAPVVDEVARRAAGVVAADVVSSGAFRAVSESGALLLREVCRVPASALVTRNYLHGEMESAGDTLHVIIGDGRELELAGSLAAARHHTLCVTSADLSPSEHLHVVPIPAAASLPVRVVLAAAVLQRLAGSLAQARGVEIEDFVFHNSDTKIEEQV